MRRSIVVILAAAGLGCFGWCCPPIRLHSLSASRSRAASVTFVPKDFAREFWRTKLLPAAEKAADAKEVLAALSTGTKTLRDRYGRTVGISNSFFVLLRGTFWVKSVQEDRIDLTSRPDSDVVEASISLDFVFGNAVRDASGLLDASMYSNAQDFNEISSELNSIVENEVHKQLRDSALPGKRLRIKACAEVENDSGSSLPLNLIPLSVQGE